MKYNYVIFDDRTGEIIQEGELVGINCIVPPMTPQDRDCRVVIHYTEPARPLVNLMNELELEAKWK
jgi:hypothetical protein